jgi:hypothetical protein
VIRLVAECIKGSKPGLYNKVSGVLRKSSPLETGNGERNKGCVKIRRALLTKRSNIGRKEGCWVEETLF